MNEDPNPKQSTLSALVSEIRRTRAKFPRNRKMTIALGEEFGELCRAQLQGKSRDEIRSEAIQVAAVAIRIFEEGDADFDGLTDEEMKP